MKAFRSLLLTVAMLLTVFPVRAEDYSQDKTYLNLREAMHNAFNNNDSAAFFPALQNFEDYLLEKGDLHSYYTQRCNEIVFLMNRQKIVEAYKRASDLSKELREKKVDKEMYMAVNMLGHINRYCGNKEEAKKNWFEVIRMMEKEGYYANMPPIYMNIVNVELDDSPEEADSLLEIAKGIALKHAPERVFDIETRQSLSYYYRGDMEKFVKGYKAYQEGVAKGLTSVHGRSMDVYYLAYQGRIDEAVKKAREELGDEGGEAIALIYANAGKWKEAYEAKKQEAAASDSIDNVVLTNSMMRIRDELRLYDVERKASKNKMILLTVVTILLALLVALLFYTVMSRRRHMKQLKRAYNHALESDKIKTAFIQNISHEVRTPLNIISGFAQVIAEPELVNSIEERKDIAAMMQKNTRQITSLIDEMLALAMNEAQESVNKNDHVEINDLMRDLLQENQGNVNKDTRLDFQTTLPDDFKILTNESLLKSILNALLDNAIKNTTNGQIVIKADIDDEQMLTLAVEDTGCGIPAAEAEHIFERFVKLDTFKEGIGLGLPLCRTLADKLGGSVKLDTTYQKGARFIVRLPIE